MAVDYLIGRAEVHPGIGHLGKITHFPCENARISPCDVVILCCVPIFVLRMSFSLSGDTGSKFPSLMISGKIVWSGGFSVMT